MKTGTDFFVSYSKNDYDIVSSIVAKMEYYGASCWFQRRNSRQEFAHAIVEGIENAKAFVVFVSSSSLKSIFVQNEIKCAIDHLGINPEYKILPVVIDEIDEQSMDFRAMNIFLGAFNMLYISEFGSTEELVLKIFDQVELELGETHEQNSIYTGNSDIERERLLIQTHLLNLYVQKYIDEIFEENPNPAILDVGCSDGSNIMSRIKDKEYSALLGVDINSQKIHAANETYTDERNTFWEIDITSDDFLPKAQEYLQANNLAGFDFIHVSMVLLHLKEPDKVLAKLHDLLSYNGRIVIQEDDDGYNQAYPRSSFFDNCFYIYEHSLESGDRRMGRKLPVLLKNAGFHDISMKSATVASIDFDGKYREAFWDLYFNPNLWDATSAEYFDDIKALELLPSVIEAHDSVREEFLKGNIFVTLGILIFVAGK